MQNFRQIKPRPPVDAAHDAKVDHANAGMVAVRPGRNHEQIALVHVGMEKPARNRGGQKAMHQHPRQPRPVIAQRRHGCGVAHLHAVDPVDHQHAFGGAHPIHLRHHKIRLASQIFRQFRRIGGFAAQIQLGLDPGLEGVDHRARPQPGKFAAQSLQMRGAPFICGQRARHILLDAGAQQLDRHRLALARHALVHLRDGCGTDRVRLDALKPRLPITATGRIQLRFHRGKRHWRQFILQPRQISRSGQPDQVRPRGQRLAKFDGSGAHGGQPAGKIRTFRRAGEHPCQPRHQPDRQRQPFVLKRPQGAVPGQPAAPHQHPPQMHEQHRVRSSSRNEWPPPRPESACISPGQNQRR